MTAISAAVRSLWATLLVAALVAALYATGVAALDPTLTIRDAVIVAGDLFGVFGAVLVVVTASIAVPCALLRQPMTADRAAAASSAGVFGLFWFGRLEPAHQLLSVKPHISAVGALDLLILIVFTAAMTLAPGRNRTRRWTARAVVFVAGSLVMTAVAAAVEPRRERSRDAQALARQLSSTSSVREASERVLLIGVDGMEWRTLQTMIDRGAMPAVKDLLTKARLYDLDNRDAGRSPEIWTAALTGRQPASTGIGGYTKWTFGGATHPVRYLPRTGIHATLFADELLQRLDASPLWDVELTSTWDLSSPAVWTIASYEGRRTGVFDPLPIRAVPEHVTGFFAAAEDEDVEVASAGGLRTYPLPRGVEPAAREAARVQLAASLFARERVDFGIYYTHFVDVTEHLHWDGDGREIAQAYASVDRGIATLVRAFGEPCTVVLMSDHGWEYSEYEHFTNPFGVLAVSPVPQPGYGGTADLLSVAPTVLALLGVPRDAAMAGALPPFHDAGEVASYAGVRPVFLPTAGAGDAERTDQLRAVGYVGRFAKRK